MRILDESSGSLWVCVPKFWAISESEFSELMELSHARVRKVEHKGS